MADVLRCPNCNNTNGKLFLPMGGHGYSCKCCCARFTDPRYPNEIPEEERHCWDGYRSIRNHAFAEAETAFREAMRVNPNSVNAHWGSLLANFGILYLRGYDEEVSKPTFCFSVRDMGKLRLGNDPLYRRLLELLDESGDPALKNRYVEQAKRIDKEIADMKGRLRQTDECKYDVFICTKVGPATADGQRYASSAKTEDSKIANALFDELTARGAKVFYSERTRPKGIEADSQIWEAMLSSKKILVIGTRREYLESVWVQSEWKRWLYLWKVLRLRDRGSFIAYIPDEDWVSIRPKEWEEARIQVCHDERGVSRKEKYKELADLLMTDEGEREARIPFEEQLRNIRVFLFDHNYEAAEELITRLEKSHVGSGELRLLKLRLLSGNFTELSGVSQADVETALRMLEIEGKSKKDNPEYIDYKKGRSAWDKAQKRQRAAAEARPKKAVKEKGRKGKAKQKESARDTEDFDNFDDFTSDRTANPSGTRGEKKGRKQPKRAMTPAELRAFEERRQRLTPVVSFFAILTIGLLLLAAGGLLGHLIGSHGDFTLSMYRFGDFIFVLALFLAAVNFLIWAILLRRYIRQRKSYIAAAVVALVLVVLGCFLLPRVDWSSRSPSVPGDGTEDFLQGEPSRDTDGVTFLSHGDGTCTIVRMGEVTEAELTLPSVSPDGDRVIAIAEGAFAGCSGLERLTVPSSVETIGKDAFRGCPELTEVTVSYGVTEIGEGAFAACADLERLVLHGSVRKIGVDAFAACDALTEIAYAGIRAEWNRMTVDEGNESLRAEAVRYSAPASEGLAFTSNGDGTCYLSGMGACNDTVLVIPTTSPEGERVIGIEPDAFGYRLRRIVIPEGVEQIAAGSIWCDELESLAIPSTATSIGAWLLSRCESLRELVVDANNPVYHSDGLCLIETESKTLISGCANSVIPTDGSVTALGEGAFHSCAGLTEMVIPNGITAIGEEAFWECDALERLRIPESVESIGLRVVAGCDRIIALEVDEKNLTYLGAGNCLIERATGTLITGCAASVIPADGQVRVIGEWAFYNHKTLRAITVPTSVIAIKTYAFLNCESLETMTIPFGVTEIHGSFIAGCTALRTLTVDAQNTVYRSAGNCLLERATGTLVAGCGSSVIPTDGSVTAIGSFAFYDCDGLTSLRIPEGVTEIGYFAFYGCKNLESLILPNSLRGIQSSAFFSCDSLKRLVIPEGVSVLEDILYGCSSLETLTIPDSVTVIEASALKHCTALTEIRYGGTVAQWEAIEKGESWDVLTGIYTVWCTDGSVTKSENP